MNLFANRPEPLATPKSVDGEFVVMEAVAFFKEHTNRDGVRIDRAALQRICDRCNERINDTGDFPPVVLRHTDDEGTRDPEVVGFAGPFYLGTIGTLRPKAAILGTMRIFAEDAAKVKKYPRLSVEYWASEDDPTNGYFDPVSLLGAETPELDLGIRYERGRRGKRPLRYAKVERFQVAAELPERRGACSGLQEAKQPHTQPAKEFAEMIDAPSTPGFNPQNTQEFMLAFVDATKPMLQNMVDEMKSELMDFINDQLGAAGLDDHPDDEDVDADGPSADDDDTAIAADDAAADAADAAADAAAERPAADDAAPPDQLHKKYLKVAARHRSLQTRYARLKAIINGEKADKRRALRYRKLAEMKQQGVVLEVDAEFADCEWMDETTFQRHCDKILTKYQRVPGGVVPITPPKLYTGESPTAKSAVKSAKYAKIASENVLKARDRGIAIEFKDELDRLMAEDGGEA